MKTFTAGCLLLLGIVTASHASAAVLSEFDVTGYGGPIYRNMDIQGEQRNSLGLRGGLLVNHSISLGLQAATDIFNGEEEDDENDTKKVGMTYGGVYASVALFPSWIVHPVGTVSQNWGVLNLDGKDADWFTMVQYEVGLEVNLAKIVRASITGGPRKVTGVSFRGRSDSDYEGNTYGLSVGVGIF